MPIYEYQCAGCGHRLEALQGINEQALSQCPQCGEASLTRLISPAGFRLKGGGWYETDFKHGRKRQESSGAESAADAGSGGNAAAASTGEGGSEKSEKSATGGVKDGDGSG